MKKIPITARPHAFYLRPAPGWRDLLFEEASQIIKTPLQKYKFDAKVTGLKSTVKVHRCDWRQGLELMLRLTTAHDVEWMILESKCTQWGEAEAILRRVPWEEVIADREIPIHVTTDSLNGFTTATANLRELFCKVAQLSHFSEGGKIRFKVELRDDFLRVSVSLCGEPLYKRGYKNLLSAVAPLPEHQAAACVRWVAQTIDDPKSIQSIFIPFAGSGTLGFETLLYLCQTGTGAFSRPFSCDLFPGTPEATMKFFRKKLADRLKLDPKPKVIFNDFNTDAIQSLKENIKVFSEVAQFEIIEQDFFSLEPSFTPDGKIIVLLNPPYGDRLAKQSDITALFSRIGKSMHSLAQKYPNRILGGCLCPDEFSWRSFLKELKLASFETQHFTHGGSELRLVRWCQSPIKLKK